MMIDSRRLITLLVLLCAVPTAALAAPYPFDLTEDKTVVQRLPEEFQPRGLRVGPLMLQPSIETLAKFNDNIFAAENGETDDYIYILKPDLKVRSDWSRHELFLQTGGEFGQHQDESDENYNDYYANGALRLDATRRLHINLRGGYEKKHERRSSAIQALGAKEPTEYIYNPFLIGARYQPGRLFIALSSAVDIYDFRDVRAVSGGIINNDDRDRVEYRPALVVGYNLKENFNAYMRGEYVNIKYDDRLDDDGLQRSSDGYEVSLGLEGNLSSVLLGNLYIGFFDRSFDDPALVNVNGLTGGIDLDWNITPLTTLGLVTEHTFEESIDGGASGFNQLRGLLTLEHELLRNFYVAVYGGYTNNSFEGINREDNITTAGLNTRFKLNRNVHLLGSYSYETRDSNAANRSYDINEFTIGVRVQY